MNAYLQVLHSDIYQDKHQETELEREKESESTGQKAGELKGLRCFRALTAPCGMCCWSV